MNVTDIHSPGSQSLHELELVIGQNEPLLGPLVDLGSVGTDTALTFDMDDLPPSGTIILRLAVGGQTPSVPGFALVCQGNCFVAGQLNGVAALREMTNAAQPAAGTAADDQPPPQPTASLGPPVSPASALAHALMAELPTALQFRNFILAAASSHKLPPSVVAGIGSQESGWGTSKLMSPNGPAGTGDRAPRHPDPPLRPGTMPPDGGGFGRGLMQIDWDFHEFARTGNWRNPQANIDFGCSLFAADRDRFVTTMQMSADDALRAAIASYNAGFGGASTKIHQQGLAATIGPGTYAGLVLPRVSFYAANGF